MTGRMPGRMPGRMAQAASQVEDVDRSARTLLAVLVGAVFTVYAVYGVSRHAQYLTGGYDLGLFDQVVRAYSRFEAPVAPLKGVDFLILGDHFHPVLAVLAPLYWIWDDPRMLLLAQAALFAASTVPVVRFAQRRFGLRVALAVGAAYAFSWPLQAAGDFDFHEIAFAIPLLALVVDALDRRATRTVALACAALLLVREDMGAVVALVGVLLALRRGPRRDRVVGIVLAVVGLAVFWLVTSVLIPALAPTGSFEYWDYTALGPDAPSALRFALTHPWDVLTLFVTPEAKARTLALLFLPTLFLALGSRYVLLTLPFLAQRMLNDREHLWTTEFHYSSVCAPLIMMAAVDTLARIVPRVMRVPWLTWAWATWVVGFVVLGTALDEATHPLRRLVTGTAFTSLSRVHDIEAVLGGLPRGVCVEADERITPHLTRHWYVTLPTKSQGLATWLVLDMKQKETGWLAPPPQVVLDAARAQGWRTAAEQGPILLLTRDGSIDARCRA